MVTRRTLGPPLGPPWGPLGAPWYKLRILYNIIYINPLYLVPGGFGFGADCRPQNQIHLGASGLPLELFWASLGPFGASFGIFWALEGSWGGPGGSLGGSLGVTAHQVSIKCPPSVHQVSIKCPSSVHQVSIECPPSHHQVLGLKIGYLN